MTPALAGTARGARKRIGSVIPIIRRARIVTSHAQRKPKHARVLTNKRDERLRKEDTEMPHPMQRVSNGRERRRLLCCARPRKQRALCSTESVRIAAIKKATVAAIDFKAAVRSAPTTSACLFFVLWMDARSRRGSRLCTERSGDDERLKSEHMFRPLYTACVNAAVLSARGGRELRAVEAVELNRQQRGSRRDPHGASNLFFQVPPPNVARFGAARAVVYPSRRRDRPFCVCVFALAAVQVRRSWGSSAAGEGR